MTCLCRNKTLKKFKRVVVCQKGISAVVSFMVMTLLSIIALSVHTDRQTDRLIAIHAPSPPRPPPTPMGAM